MRLHEIARGSTPAVPANHRSRRTRILGLMAAAGAALAASLAVGADPPAHVRVGAAAPVGPHADAHHECVPPAVAALARQQADLNRGLLGLLPVPCVQCPAEGGVAGGSSPAYAFFPLAGVIGSDIMNGQFVDLDATSPGFHDFDCRLWTYDGHRGTDGGLRSFGEQFVGMPVFAARDGVVVFAQDGYPDTNLNGGFMGNVIFIDHGDGYESQYWHLKNGSVLVSVGQAVKAGQEIGRAASSGNSFGPHLHFETVVNGPGGWEVYEPFAGPCRPGDSGWVDQAPLDTEAPFFVDFGITRTFLDGLQPPWWEPWPLPTDGQLGVADPYVVFWWQGYNFPVDALVRVKFTRPDGSVADDAQWNWGNTEIYRYFKNWFAWEIPWLQPQVGTWRLQFWLDGIQMVDAHFEMVTTPDPGFNRPPAAVGAVLVPGTPEAGAPLACRVVGTPLQEDPDWDLVQYHWVWRINGGVVRDVTTAAWSDMIPSNLVVPGAAIQCTVTPSDGLLQAAPAVASATVPGGVPGDLNGDGHVNGADLGLMLATWGPCSGCPGDITGDGFINGADLGILLAAWTG